MEYLKLPKSWQEPLSEVMKSSPVAGLERFLEQETAHKDIYPPKEQWFAAFEAVNFEDVKVVILGQDPYHGEGQAHGLSFSVKPGVKVPPSLRNMYKELASDVGFSAPSHGYLKSWANQGVLLLNSVLTVEKGQANSHKGKGWEEVTDAAIAALSKKRSGLVFLLWGAYAHKKGAAIDESKHLVLKTVHPSPLSARHGFFGCRHFSKTNAYLESCGQKGVDWQLPESV